MKTSSLRQNAEKLFRECAPPGFDLESTRLEVVPKDGTLLLLRQATGEDPIALLRGNAFCGTRGAPGPVLVDPETGCTVRRFVLPFKKWCRPGGLRDLLGEEGGDEAASHHESLRLLKGIAPCVGCHRYGRSRRLSLLLDRPHAVLAARIFPSNLLDANLLLSPECLAAAARILLTRSAVSVRAYHFHMLRTDHFVGVERAALVAESDDPEGFRSLETDLINSAEEDREILQAILSSRVPWELIGDGRITVTTKGESNHDGKF